MIVPALCIDYIFYYIDKTYVSREILRYLWLQLIFIGPCLMQLYSVGDVTSLVSRVMLHQG